MTSEIPWAYSGHFLDCRGVSQNLKVLRFSEEIHGYSNWAAAHSRTRGKLEMNNVENYIVWGESEIRTLKKCGRSRKAENDDQENQDGAANEHKHSMVQITVAQ